MAQELDDAAVLAYLKAKRAALDASITNLEAYLGRALSNDGVTPGPRAATAGGEAEQLGPGTFHGMSVSEAARKYLELTKKKQKTRAICDALRDGGIETDAKNFYGNVYTTLQRTKDFIKLGKFWALAEWHPTRVIPQEKPPKKTRKARKPSTTKGAPKAASVVAGSSDNPKKEAAGA